MEICIIILSFIIILLLSYLFFIKLELKRIFKSISLIRENDSNNVINAELSVKELILLINEINKILKDEKKAKINSIKQEKDINNMLLNMSHDLRTPLTSALGYVGMLKKSKNLTSDDLEEIHIIEGRLLRLEDLIDSFFVFSKYSINENEIELTCLNIVGILEEAVVSFYDDFSKMKRDIKLNKEANKCMIYTNKDLVIRIFENLISNAYKHSSGNLNISIFVDEFIEFEFSNKLEDKLIDVDKIFDEFYTEDISRTKGNTGLGLAIAKKFTNLLGGVIDANIKKEYLVISLKFKIK